jgi:hypothetical protein
MDTRVNTRCILIFLAFAFGFSCAVTLAGSAQAVVGA